MSTTLNMALAMPLASTLAVGGPTVLPPTGIKNLYIDHLNHLGHGLVNHP